MNEEGQGIAGILVRLNDLVTRTELDGSYEFPVVPVGDRCLMVDPFDIGIGRIVKPATPLCFRIEAGERVIQNLELIPAARVSGIIEIQPLPETITGENAVFGQGKETDVSILNGTVIELRSGDEVHRQVIRVSSGDEKIYKSYFRFDQVLPGDWEMVVHLSSCSKAYSVEYPRRIIQVGPVSSMKRRQGRSASGDQIRRRRSSCTDSTATTLINRASVNSEDTLASRSSFTCPNRFQIKIRFTI